MTLVVEDGSGKSDAESYVSVEDFAAYVEKRGIALPALGPSDAETALRRASAWLDATYRGRFPGVRNTGRTQRLEWPRGWAVDVAGNAIAADEVPAEIVDATCEAAVREINEPGVLSPDLERGGAVQRLKAGSVEIEYAGNATALTSWSAIDNALSGVLKPAMMFSGRAVRG